MIVKLAHAIPGRIRLKVPEIRENGAAVAELEQRLASLSELRDVQVNPASASVILYYDATPADGVLDKLEALFDGFNRDNPASDPGDRQMAGAISGWFGRVDQSVEQATGMGLKLMVPVLLISLAALALGGAVLRRKKTRLPSWYELLWFAFNTFIILNLPFPERGQKDQ